MGFGKIKKKFVKNAEKQALKPKQKKEVEKIVKANLNRELELKFVYSGNLFSLQAINNTGFLTKNIFTVAQGTLDTNRVGDALTWCGKLWLRCQWVTAGDNFNLCRVIILQWHPNDATAPTIANLFLPGPTGAVDVNSSYNHDTRPQYKILFDRSVMIGPVGFTNTCSKEFTTSISLNRASKHVQFTGATTNGTNQIYIYAIASNSGNLPALTVSSKLFYRDA